MTAGSTDGDTVQGPAVSLRVTADLVAAFAALTGDRSSLHVSDAFARRSAYRRPVAHGLLPVAFLALTGPFRRPGIRTRLRAISGRFTAPVFDGDALRITTTAVPGGEGGSGTEFDYRIENVSSGTIVTRGSAGVVAAPPASPASDAVTGRPALAEAMDESHWRFEDISLGDGDLTPFTVSPAAVQAFERLLQLGTQGLDHPPAHEPAGGCDVADLLALLMFSTSVGVRLPGASATFLEFSAAFDAPITLDEPYALQATVVHRSAATRIIKKEMAVHRVDDASVAVVRGKVSTLVAKPARAMPASSDLKAALDWDLHGKVALVTGASRGLGETTAKLLALAGARVVVNYHRGADDARRVVDDIVAAGGQAEAIAADVSSPDEVASMVSAATARFGAIDILVNNAARDFRPSPFMKLSWRDVQADLDVIAKGAFLCCQAVLPSMLEKGAGKIINISTVATDDPPPDQTKYVMAKSALVGLTRSLSIEFAARNIQVNMVVPNFVETDLVAHIPEGFRKKLADDTPMKRHASPVDVARAVLFLASSHAGFTTGQKVLVTGGGAPYS